MYYILEETVPYLPVDKPTYLMGVGTPANILEGVERGIDFLTVYIPAGTGGTGTYIPTGGRLTFLMRSMNWISVLLKRGVTARHVEGIPGLTSDICLRQRRCLACGFVCSIIYIFIIL